MKKVSKLQLFSLILFGFILSLFLLEGFLRITTSGQRWVNSHYVEISSAFPELEALIDDTQNTPPHKYYDEFLYAPGPVALEHINFTEYYSSRLTPDSVPLPEAENIVWTFGGSTMENTETTDRLTIANTLAKKFNNSLGPTHVKNFGSGGFISSYELIKFQKLLREIPESEHPDLAIFYDGYNDAQYGFQFGPGSLQKDLSLKLQALVEQQHGVMWLYSTSNILTKYSRLWERTGARLVDYLLFPLPEPNPDFNNLRDTIRVYTSNVRMIQAICEAYNVDCFFILQPLIVTKGPLSELEQNVLNQLEAHPRFGVEGSQFMRAFYDFVIDELDENEDFIDASNIMDGRDQPDFYDVGHTSALTSPIIGEKLADLMLERIVLDSNPPNAIGRLPR